jgi:hypothetical protein
MRQFAARDEVLFKPRYYFGIVNHRTYIVTEIPGIKPEPAGFYNLRTPR